MHLWSFENADISRALPGHSTFYEVDFESDASAIPPHPLNPFRTDLHCTINDSLMQALFQSAANSDYEDLDLISLQNRLSPPKGSGFPREFNSWIIKKVLAGRIKPAFLCQIFRFYICYFMLLCDIIRGRRDHPWIFTYQNPKTQSHFISANLS